jgi:type II secretory pathway pseudopilin PulG
MKNKSLYLSGFTIVEILVSLAILIIIASIGTSAFINAKKTKTLDVTAESIVSKLNEAKTNAIAGKDNASFGIYFGSGNPDHYVYFSGSTYNSSDTDNVRFDLPKNMSLDENSPSADPFVLFARRTGKPNATSTVEVYWSDDTSDKRIIEIGPNGEVNYTR